MFIWIVIGFGIVHVVAYGFLLMRFHLLPTFAEKPHYHSFSIIVPVRNEQANIALLLQQLAALDYPADRYEVIVVDDASEDDTVKLARKSTAHVYELPVDKIGKKAAIEWGVSKARNEIILTTDGDCEVKPHWLRAFNQCFEDDTKLVVGPVRMKAASFIGALQSFDFSVLIGYAAGLVGMGIPSMSNGANLAYRREIFEEVGGYNGNRQVPSGDDEFLLLKVVKKYPEGIRFCNDTRAVVSTAAKKSFNDLLNQRVRWLSKWTVHNNLKIMLSVILILLDNLAMMAAMLAVIMGWVPVWIFGVFLARWLIKLAFSYRVNRLLAGRTYVVAALVYELLYPFYVVLLAIASIFGHYIWKGRIYR